MERRVGKLNRWIAALFLCLAAGLCALAGTLFVRAETVDIPVPDSACAVACREPQRLAVGCPAKVLAL